MNNNTLELRAAFPLPSKGRGRGSILKQCIAIAAVALLWFGGTAAGGTTRVAHVPADSIDVDDVASALLEETDSVMSDVPDSVLVEVGDTMRVSYFFSNMPDSLLPYLSHNNRLDLVDFMNSGMKAVVTNKFEEQTEMTMLTTDSLSLLLNPVHRFDMLLVRGRIDLGEEENLLCIRDIYGRSEEATERSYRFFTLHSWLPIDAQRVRLSDEKLELEKNAKMLGIFKWVDKRLKNI